MQTGRVYRPEHRRWNIGTSSGLCAAGQVLTSEATDSPPVRGGSPLCRSVVSPEEKKHEAPTAGPSCSAAGINCGATRPFFFYQVLYEASS